MLAAIWALIGPFLVNLALTVGLPQVVAYLKEKKWPSWIVDLIMPIVTAVAAKFVPVSPSPVPTPGLYGIAMSAGDRIRAVKANTALTPELRKAEIKSIKAEAKAEAKRHCTGTACPPKLVSE